MNEAELLRSLVGQELSAVRRINYVLPDGSCDRREGPLELTVRSELTVRLDSSSDGESLHVEQGQWEDPFRGSLSPENIAFLKTAGKWTAFDVSGDNEYRSMIGRSIEQVKFVTRAGKTVGVDIVISAAVIRAEVVADELVVDLVRGS
ncbi:hypothetical protein GCM10010169_15200 [Micromonospora fulviviridis]|nr:hypothetical protein GCM10010169_15200 [Micromonospora fulviviridis]